MRTKDSLSFIRRRRKGVPTWTSLRAIGNSRAVQASAIFPAVGYLILLNNDVTAFFNGGLAYPQISQQGLLDQLWATKLYFIYFGLLNFGLASALYQWRCPRQIKKHGDWEDYVRVDGPAMTSANLMRLDEILRKIRGDEASLIGVGSIETSRSRVLNSYYAVCSTDDPVSRALVSYLFMSGFACLAIPSFLSVTRVTMAFIRLMAAPVSTL